MADKNSIASMFDELAFEDKNLIMFTLTSLQLEETDSGVQLVLRLKRKIQTELLTTYLPTMLLLGITFATTFFKPMYFEVAL
jgi:hypothetical protein